MCRVTGQLAPEIKRWMQQLINNLAMKDRFKVFLSSTGFWVKLDRNLRNAKQRVALRDAKTAAKATLKARDGGE